MEIEFLGHACVAIFANGETLLIDPYESGQFGGKLAYRPIDVEADWVVCTHEHLDHNATSGLPGDPVLVESGEAGAFDITRTSLWHDEYDGRRRGGAVDAVRVETSSHSVLHLSDVGESPRPDFVEQHRDVDVLLIPTGGFYTIGAAQAWEWVERLRPGVAIAVHYRTSACHLPMRDEVGFASWCDAKLWNSYRIHVEKTLPDRLIVRPRLV